MKVQIILSVLFHALVFSLIIILPSRSRSLRASNIVEVALVSMPRNIESVPKTVEPARDIEPEEPSPAPAVKPEVKKVEAPVTPVDKSETKTPETSESDSAGSEMGVPGGQVKVETEDFPFAYYLALIRFRIQENWRPPIDESRRRMAVVGFRVLRAGRVENIQLEQPSGRFLFDQAAERAIHSMGNLPPLPDEFRGEHLTVHIEFESIW